jgi:hypothetical protein
MVVVVDDAKTPTKATFDQGLNASSKYEIFNDGVLLSDVLAQTGGDTERAHAAAGGNESISILREEDIIDASEYGKHELTYRMM